MPATVATTAPVAVTCRHVDTCLSCYLTDHHNRPGELLVGVPVNRGTRVHEVRAELMITAAHGGADGDAPPADDIKAAVAACFAGTHPLRAFDRSLDAASDVECGDTCEAWFLITWPVSAEPVDSGPDVDTVTLPTAWACYLINGDASGLDDGEAETIDAHLASVLPAGGRVVSIVDDSERFTWYYATHGGNARGGDVADYIVLTPREPAPAMVPMPAQQQQACAARHGDSAHAEAAEWLGYVSACVATALDVSGFDAAVTEAVDTLLRRGCITPRAASCLLAFFDTPRLPAVAAIVDAPRPIDRLRGRTFADHAARIAADATGDAGCAPAMVAQPVQQQQARHTPCPVHIGPSVYEAGAALAARVLGRKPWAAPVIAPAAVPATMAHEAHWFEVWRARATFYDNANDACDYSGEIPDGPGMFYPGITPDGLGGFICTINASTDGSYFFLDDIEDIDTRRDFATLYAAECALWANIGEFVINDRAGTIAHGYLNDDDSEGPAVAETAAHNARCTTDLAYFTAVMGGAGIGADEAARIFARNAADRAGRA